MKVTSQIRSATCVTPTFWPAKTWLSLLRRGQEVSPVLALESGLFALG